jgi:xanthine/uracil/vitamin C permease (AzgA family)
MALRLILLVLGLFHLVNGVWMFASPDSWYAAVPGVSLTGPNNHHFVADAGLAFIASGAGMALGLRKGVLTAALGLAGAIWPLLHALLHIAEWIAHGFPNDANVAISEGLGVVLVGVTGFALAWINARKQGVV